MRRFSAPLRAPAGGRRHRLAIPAPPHTSRLRIRGTLGTLVGTALVFAAAGVGAQEAPTEEDWSIERIDREVEIDGDRVLEIENLLGDLRVRIGTTGRMEIHAVVQRHPDDPRRAELEIPPGQGSKLRVGFEPELAGEEDPAWRLRRVDLALGVPPRARLRLRTGSGLIEVKGEVGALEADSTGGDVRLWVASECRVRTEEGSIAAFLLGDSWSKPARFETVNGAIEVELPARAQADLRAETSGRVTTDFSVEIEWPGLRRKRALARLGEGGAEVVLSSENGDIALLRRLPRERGDRDLGERERLR